MKKIISLLTAVSVLTIMLVGCSGKKDELVGTWKADSVEVDGTRYTISELESMGDNSLNDSQIVIKEGGKAYVADGNNGDIVDWNKTDTGVKIGEQDCTVVDEMICLKHGEGKVFFKKISDSQEIGVSQTDKSNNSSSSEQSESKSVTVKASPDKYTWYIKNYVGKNCASIGRTNIDGERIDEYGDAEIKLIITSQDGTFVDPDDEEALKKYVVTVQNIAPNTELKLTYAKSDSGKEYSFLETQSIEEIELTVKPVGGK